MTKSLILQESSQMPYYTDVSRIFEAFGNLTTNYNWMITNVDCGLPREAFQEWREPFLLTGEELSQLLASYSEELWDWGVFSGFPKEINLGTVADVLPYADGNPGFWVAEPQIQHPNAVVELVCWDTSLVILLSKEPEFLVRFQSAFSDAVDLAKFNREQMKRFNKA